MEITFLNIHDNLRPTYFFHFFIGISSGSDTHVYKVHLFVRSVHWNDSVTGVLLYRVVPE